MSKTPLALTIQSYDRIAADYLARRCDRSVMNEYVDRFVDLLVRGDCPAPLVADIGCGPGFDAAVLRSRGLKVVGLDLSLGMILAGKEQYPGDFVQADMRHLPLASLLDGLWVNASLLHLPRPEVPAALAGFSRSLRRGGILFLAVKEGNGAGWQPHAYDHDEPRFFTYWQAEAIDQILNQAGLNIVSSRRNSSTNSTTWLTLFARK